MCIQQIFMELATGYTGVRETPRSPPPTPLGEGESCLKERKQGGTIEGLRGSPVTKVGSDGLTMDGIFEVKN